MTSSTSSASPQTLLHYADVAKSINGLLDYEAAQLEGVLARCAASCTEPQAGIGLDLVNHLRTYLHMTLPCDEWVRMVAQAFQQADQNIFLYSSPMQGLALPSLPQNMAELMEQLDKQSERVQIVRIGPDEYLVLVKGTMLQRHKYQDLTGAIQGGKDIPGDYERYVLDMLRAHIPEGANIHFAGHSLGGITANNLADNQDLLDDYNVKTVTTFGAPVSARETPDVVYTRFRNATDPVPTFDPELLAPVTRAKALREYFAQTPIDSGDELFGAHNEDAYVEGLNRAGWPALPEELQRNLQEWEYVAGGNGDRESTPGRNAISSTPLLNLVFTRADVQFESARTLVLSKANHNLDKVLDLLGSDGMRNTIDRYRDRANHTVMSLPTPTEAAGTAIDKAVEGSEKVKDLLDDLRP